jgi:hypothetical protein
MSHVCGSRERNDALLVLAIVCATAKYGGYCRGGGRFRPVVVAGHWLPFRQPWAHVTNSVLVPLQSNSGDIPQSVVGLPIKKLRRPLQVSRLWNWQFRSIVRNCGIGELDWDFSGFFQLLLIASSFPLLGSFIAQLVATSSTPALTPEARRNGRHPPEGRRPRSVRASADRLLLEFSLSFFVSPVTGSLCCYL